MATFQFVNVKPYAMKSYPPIKRVVCSAAISRCYRPAPKDAGFHFVQATTSLTRRRPSKGVRNTGYPLKGSSYSFTLNLPCIMSLFS